MKAHLIKQYESIRNAIGKNVETIKAMLEQADSLSVLAESLSDETAGQTKKDLEDQISKMHKSIGLLIDQTTELFKLYDRFADELFR